MNLIPWRHKKKENGAGEAMTAPFNRFREEMDRVLDRVFGEPWNAEDDFFTQLARWSPTLDLAETDDAYTVRVEVPGIEPKDMDITVSGYLLTLRGEKKESTQCKEERLYRSERRYGSFQRTLQLPAQVDPEHVSAECANGVLTIQLHKKPGSRSKRVPVLTAST